MIWVNSLYGGIRWPVRIVQKDFNVFFSKRSWQHCMTVSHPILGSLRSYDGNCNGNVALKLNFALSEVFCDYSMLVTFYKIGGVHFRLLGTNGFHVKAKKKGLLLRARVVVNGTSNMKISRSRLPDYVKRLHQKACCTSAIIFLHSTNQIIDLWRCR